MSTKKAADRDRRPSCAGGASPPRLKSNVSPWRGLEIFLKHHIFNYYSKSPCKDLSLLIFLFV